MLLMDILAGLFAAKRGRIGERRKEKYTSNYKTIEKIAGGDIESTLGDGSKTLDLAEKIDATTYKPNTKKDLKVLLKQLWKIKNGRSLKERPTEIENISTCIKRSDVSQPKGLITDVEMKAMLKQCQPRDAAMLSLLYEAGPRVSELVALKKSDVEFLHEGARIHIPEGTKTGARSVLVVDAVPALAAWIQFHPMKDDDAPLFVGKRGFGSKNWTALAPESVNKMLKETAQKAGIRRRIYPHLYRHSSATSHAKHFTDRELMGYYGWRSSKTVGVYVQMSGKDCDDAVLRMHGRSEGEKIKDELEPKRCERCNFLNDVKNIRCGKCGLALDKMALKKEELARDNELKEMRATMTKQAAQIAKLEDGRAFGTVKQSKKRD